MRKFAEEVIKFLQETYQDAYKYEVTINTGIYWQDALELNVVGKCIKIYIPPTQMFSLYQLYKEDEHEMWQSQLVELIEN